MILNNLLNAIENNDYDAFLKDATIEVKAALTKHIFEGVISEIAPHIKKGTKYLTLGY